MSGLLRGQKENGSWVKACCPGLFMGLHNQAVARFSLSDPVARPDPASRSWGCRFCNMCPAAVASEAPCKQAGLWGLVQTLWPSPALPPAPLGPLGAQLPSGLATAPGKARHCEDMRRSREKRAAPSTLLTALRTLAQPCAPFLMLLPVKWRVRLQLWGHAQVSIPVSLHGGPRPV